MSVVGAEHAHRVLEQRLADVCGHLNVQHAALVAIAGEALDSGGWEGGGIHSPAHWLAWKTGLSPQRAGQIVVIARRRAALPVTFAAFAAGELALDQVAVVAKYVPDRCDRQACDLAKAATVAQLRAALSKYRFTKPDPKPDTKPDREPSVADHVGMGYNDDGRFTMNVNAALEAGAVIETAMREARDALWRAGNKDVTWLDALLEICNRSLDTITSTSRTQRFRINIHLDTAGAWLHQGPALPDHVLHKICCDGVVRAVWETEGTAVNVGRSTPVIPEQTRMIIQNRDRTCIHPACPATTNLEIHHIDHWLDLGPTETWNLASLCPSHHDKHHQGRFTITGNADIPGGLQFRDERGRIIASSAQPNPPNRPPPPPAKPYLHPTGETMHTKWLDFHNG